MCAVMVMEDEGGSSAVEIAERILEALHAPFIVDGASLYVGVSIGVTQRRPDGVDAAGLLRQADVAMYMAKGSGKARFQLFNSEMRDNMVGRPAGKTDRLVRAS